MLLRQSHHDEAGIREEVEETLHISVQASCNYGRSDGMTTPRRAVPYHHTSLCWWHEHPSGKRVSSKYQLDCYSCGGNHTANYDACSKLTEAKAAAAKPTHCEHGRKDGVPRRLQLPNQPQVSLLPNWRNCTLAALTFSVVAASSSLRLRQTLPLSSVRGSRTVRQAAPTDGQCNHACPQVSAVDPQPPNSKQA